MKFAILQKCDETQKALLDVSSSVNKIYADSYNYLYIIDGAPIDSARHPRWMRYPALRRQMIQNPDVDWFLWLDADVLIMNHNIPIDMFLKNKKESTEIIVEPFECPKSYAIEGIGRELKLTWLQGQEFQWISYCTGCMLLRNSSWMHTFLLNLYTDHRFWDSGMSAISLSDELAFTIVIKENKAYSQRTLLLPRGSFISCDKRERKPQSVDYYKDGHFSIHISGYSISYRKQQLEKYAKMIKTK